jgi:hypothetical protein
MALVPISCWLLPKEAMDDILVADLSGAATTATAVRRKPAMHPWLWWNGVILLLSFQKRSIDIKYSITKKYNILTM